MVKDRRWPETGGGVMVIVRELVMVEVSDRVDKDFPGLQRV